MLSIGPLNRVSTTIILPIPAEHMPIALLTEQKFLTIVIPRSPCPIIF